MIVVTAATGHLGRLAVDSLLKSTTPSDIAVIVRDPEKARDFASLGIEVRRGDYNDLVSLRRACIYADHLLFISSPETDNAVRIAQHMNVIEAAMEVEVRHIAYTSYLGAAEDLPGPLHAHYVTERAIERSGVPYTFLRNSIYTESLLSPEYLRAAVDAGVVVAATDGHKVNSATRLDLADAAAAVVSSTGHEHKAYHLTGPLWTYSEVAEILGRISGRPVAYRETSVEEMGACAWVFQLIRSGALETTSPDLERLMRHPAMPLEQYLLAAL